VLQKKREDSNERKICKDASSSKSFFTESAGKTIYSVCHRNVSVTNNGISSVIARKSTKE
jgi:hypothetical protein